MGSHTKTLAERVASSFVIANPRLNALPSYVRHLKPEEPKGTDLQIWVYELAGSPYGIAFSGRANKPLWHFKFKNEAQLRKKIDETIEISKAHLDSKNKAREERKNAQHHLEVGDFFYSSWGYDQTNIDFYQVTEVKGKQVTIREVGKREVSQSQTSVSVVPMKDNFTGPSMKKIPQVRGSSVYVKVRSSGYAYLWDGRPRSETAFGYGH